MYYNEYDEDIGTNFAGDLKLPFVGGRNYSDASFEGQGVGYYWSSSPNLAVSYEARILLMGSSYVFASTTDSRAYGNSVRCFKDEYVIPTFTITFMD